MERSLILRFQLSFCFLFFICFCLCLSSSFFFPFSVSISLSPCVSTSISTSKVSFGISFACNPTTNPQHRHHPYVFSFTHFLVLINYGLFTYDLVLQLLCFIVQSRLRFFLSFYLVFFDFGSHLLFTYVPSSISTIPSHLIVLYNFSTLCRRMHICLNSLPCF